MPRPPKKNLVAQLVDHLGVAGFVAVTVGVGVLVLCGGIGIVLGGLFLFDRPPQPAAKRTVDPNADVVEQAGDNPAPATLQQSALIGPIGVKIRRIEVGKIPMRGAIGDALYYTDERIAVWLGVTNVHDTQQVPWKRWRTALIHGQPTLQDDLGNVYTPQWMGDYRPLGTADSGEVMYAGARMETLVVFDPPVANAKSFTLHLPATAVGQTGEFLFTFSATAIQPVPVE